jgi:uncharacterized protein YjbI with pentapeptide repeats
MPIEIKHRFTGAILHTVEADTLSGANLSGADLSGANLYGADLSGANLSRADLGGANLSGADLRGANLYGADLSGANLSRADLGGATIHADKLDRILARATRVSDGHEFFFFALQDGPEKIKAGCRWMTIADYRAHVAANYPDTDKARETLAILNYFEACTHD